MLKLLAALVALAALEGCDRYSYTACNAAVEGLTDPEDDIENRCSRDVETAQFMAAQQAVQKYRNMPR